MSKTSSSSSTKAASAARNDKTTEQAGGAGDVTDEAAVAAETDGRKVNEPQNGDPAHSGPGTGTPAPPESTYRMPSTLVTNPDAAPLDPPQDTPTQVQPEQGHNASSTDHVYAEAGGRTVAGEDHLGLVDEDGNALTSFDDLFDDTNKAKTSVVAKHRTFEQFYYPNTTEVARRLMFPAGARVPRSKAAKIVAAMDVAPTPSAHA